jgi:hypothetical protein
MRAIFDASLMVLVFCRFKAAAVDGVNLRRTSA